MSALLDRPIGPSLRRRCDLLGVSRATGYRYRAPWTPSESETALRHNIQQIALEMPFYGYRRISKELKRQGISAGERSVRRIMRQDNLLCLRKRGFVITTDSNHALPVYQNLAKDLLLTGINQLWRADITYIRLRTEFIYLAVILDAFSRRVIGWAIGRRLSAAFCLDALKQALSCRELCPELVHHSDRGVQYASLEYTDLLKQHGIKISMSRRANPYDNAQMESFMKTLKYEEVYLREYENLTEAQTLIGHFLEDVYNQKRLHSAIGYLPPAEFENTIVSKTTTP